MCAIFSSIGLVDGEEVFLRVDHVVLRPGNTAQSDARLERFVIDAETLQRGLDDCLLVGFVVDCKRARKAFTADLKRFNVATQYAYAKAMERRKRRPCERRVADDFLDALCHFLCGFVGEGDGEDVIRADAALFNQVRDAMSDDAGFAAAGARRAAIRGRRRRLCRPAAGGSSFQEVLTLFYLKRFWGGKTDNTPRSSCFVP